MKIRILGTMALLAVAGISSAGVTALNQIPIADIIGHREAYLTYWAAGTERKISKEIVDGAAFEVGLFDRIELGVDNDFEGNNAYNIKLLLAEDVKEGKWALSAGYMGVDKDAKEKTPFAAGRWNMNEKLRLHAGWMKTDKNRWFAGADYALNEEWALLVDTVEGKDSYTMIGLYGPLKGLNGMDITLSGGIPHTRSNGYIWAACVGFAFRL